ncbi:MAG TPA: site-specific integrase [Sporichthyaceae bacterium]|jgi:integrase|nr:site-specific integrase [Sporichthyaceae bacterium]
MPRASNGRSSIYQSADGSWHGWVTVGVKPDGSPDRRHREAKTRAEVTRRVRELERQRETGQTVAGRVPTVTIWLREWLDTIAPRTASRASIKGTYRPKVEHWIIPRIGGHRLDKLRPEHLDALYLELAGEGLSPKSILMVHQIISRSLRMAMRRGILGRNVATLVDAPRHREAEMTPLSAEEARAILAAAAGTVNGARWSVALALGLRQCETLGMRWRYIDFDRAEARIYQLKPDLLQHGCSDPRACGTRYHTANCSPGCANHAQYCPKRHGGGWTFTEPKGGKARTIAIPPQLLSQLRAHRVAQAAERLRAGEVWEDWDLLFPGPDGRPVPGRYDWAAWKQLVAKAGLRDTRLHDARHTAATLLLEQGVDIRVVQQILGHSTLAVTKRYTHVTDKLAHDAAERIGRALWSS